MRKKITNYELRITRIFLLILFALHSSLFTAQAQYYDWGASPANVRWKKLQTGDVKLIYPDSFEENARRVMWYLDTLRNHIDYGYRRGTMPTPVVVHTQNMIGNGMVMWAPKRMELLASPSEEYSEPSLKRLVVHENRHNVQYNNLRRGLNRGLMWLLGQQAAFLGVGQFSIYALEGDAVMAETEMSAFGRGLQPSFTMHYRAVGNVGEDGRAGDYWFSGSLRDYVPDHYRLGYQMVRWSYNHFDDFIWDEMARYVSRNPQLVMPVVVGLRKKYDTTPSDLFRGAFAELNRHWRSLPAVKDSSVRIPTPWTSYTTYRWPLWQNPGVLVAFKSDMDRPSRVVGVNAAMGSEQILAYTGRPSSRPVLANGRLWWTEYRSSLLWAEKVNSKLVSYDLATDRKKTYPSPKQLLYPVVVGTGGEMAFVSYDYSGRFSIVKGMLGDGFREPDKVIDFPMGIEITGLAWDEATHALYFIGLEDAGMFLGSIPGFPFFEVSELPLTDRQVDDLEGFRRLTPSRHITISELRAADGILYFGSIVSGKDEAHAYDPATGTEYRLSTSAFGSFQPSAPVSGAIGGGKVALTTYDKHGYHLALQSVTDAAVQPARELPVDLVNPQWRRWNLPKMDSLVYTPAAARRSEASMQTPKRYRKMLHLFRPHSWVPLDFYPPAALEEADIQVRAGATLMSQNLLSDAVSWLSYGWTGPQGGSMLRGGLSYRGLGPVLDVEFTWGGARQTLFSTIPPGLGIKLKPYFSATTRLGLPMSLGSGYWLSSLNPSVEYMYTNGIRFKPVPGTGTGKLTRGVERLTLGLGYSGQARMAYREFLPRWAVVANARWVTNPTSGEFKDMWMASAGVWLPGVVRPHSLNLRAAWQQTADRKDAPYVFRLKELFPRGASYNFIAWEMVSTSVDYQLPVWYPEGGWTSFIYFKRVRVNLFADLLRWKNFGGNVSGTSARIVTEWHTVTSWGGDVILDISPLRMPATTHVSLKLTLAKPSDRRGVFFGFGMDVPL